MIVVYAALSFLGALTLAALVLMPGRWWWRAGAIVVVALLNGLVLWSVPNTDGLASRSAMPEGSLISCLVDEPRFVYFWLELEGLPRAYRVAYDEQTHAACDAAKKAAAQGVGVSVRRATAADRRRGFRGRYVPYVNPPQGGFKGGSP